MKRTAHIYLAFIGVMILQVFITSCNEDGESTDSNSEAEYLADYDGPDNKWGFLDPNGEVAIEARYDQVSAFSEGLAAANYKGRWGYIDRAGDVIIPFEYLATWPFENGVARVTTFEGNQCLIKKDGTTHCPEGAIELRDASGGLMQVVTAGGEGYVDLQGNMVIDPIYERTTKCRNGYAVVTRAKQSGIIDTAGRVIIPMKYQRLGLPSDGVICAQRADNQYLYIDIDGVPISENTYRKAGDFIAGRAAVQKDDGWYLIDRSESSLAGPFNTLINLNQGLWGARRAEGFALLDSNGAAMTEHKYAQINKFSQGMAVFMKDRLCGYLDTTGTEVLPPQYGLAWDFNEGLARAAFSDGIAFIDKTGNVPWIPEYYEFRDFSEGRAAFQEN